MKIPFFGVTYTSGLKQLLEEWVTDQIFRGFQLCGGRLFETATVDQMTKPGIPVLNQSSKPKVMPKPTGTPAPKAETAGADTAVPKAGGATGSISDNKAREELMQRLNKL